MRTYPKEPDAAPGLLLGCALGLAVGVAAFSGWCWWVGTPDVGPQPLPQAGDVDERGPEEEERFPCEWKRTWPVKPLLTEPVGASSPDASD